MSERSIKFAELVAYAPKDYAKLKPLFRAKVEITEIADNVIIHGCTIQWKPT